MKKEYMVSIFNDYNDFITLLLIVSSFFILIFVFKFLFKRFYKKLSDKKYLIQQALLLSVKPPLFLSLYFYTFYFIMLTFKKYLSSEVLSYLNQAPIIILLLTIIWFLFSFINNLQKILTSRRKQDKQFLSSIDIIFKLIRITVMLITILLILSKIGIKMEALLAFGGVGGLIIGFAAKDIISSFFSTFMIYFDNPFQVGEMIFIPSINIEGSVENIGWRYTTLMSLNKIPLYIPNSILISSVIENKTRMCNLRFRETIGIRYDDMDKVKNIVTDIELYIQKSKYIDQSQSNYVNLDSFGDFSVNILINALTLDTNYLKYTKIKQEMFLEIAKIVKSNNAELAFPTNVTYLIKANN